jgi:hypothetical protein
MRSEHPDDFSEDNLAVLQRAKLSLIDAARRLSARAPGPMSLPDPVSDSSDTEADPEQSEAKQNAKASAGLDLDDAETFGQTDLEDPQLVAHVKQSRDANAACIAAQAVEIELLRRSAAARKPADFLELDARIQRALSALARGLDEQRSMLRCSSDNIHLEAENCNKLRTGAAAHGYSDSAPENFRVMQRRLGGAASELAAVSAALTELSANFTLARRDYEIFARCLGGES